MPSMLTCSL